MKGRFGIVVFLLCVLLVPNQTGNIATHSRESNQEMGSTIFADYNDTNPFVVDVSYLENNCTGTGTAEDPFIIENLRIESNQSCITVGYLDSYTDFGNGTVIVTYRHLLIRNCLFVGIPHVWPTGDIDLKGNGVYLYNYAHNVTVEDNRFEKLWNGVRIFYRSNNSIVKDNYFNCSYGVRIDDTSSENVICNNTFVGGPDHPNPGTYGCGQHGVSISNSAGNYIINNTFIGLDNGVELWHGAANTTVFNNTITDAFYNAIDLSRSNFVVVANNTCMYNYYFGIWIDEESTNCTIANNTFAYNGHGFEIPTANTTAYSFASDTPGRGIYISQGSSGNEIKFNDMVHNQVNALDEVPGNQYDYNFWTDYTGTDSNDDDIGDTPYYVQGGGGGVDTHPSMIPWSPTPPVRIPTQILTPTPTEVGTNPLATYLMVGFGLAVTAIIMVVVIKQRKT